MNQAFLTVLNASAEDRKGLFTATANRLGVPFQHIEKDFWVCLVLDILFNNRKPNKPRLLFKGGTPLSKAYSLISRFSEDIDITLFREDLELNMSLDELENLSGKQQRKYFEKLKNASQQYLCETLKPELQLFFSELGEKIFHAEDVPYVEVDPNDSSNQTILVHYKSLNHSDSYVRPTIKIEAGARSALEPHRYVTLSPYIADDIDSDEN